MKRNIKLLSAILLILTFALFSAIPFTVFADETAPEDGVISTEEVTDGPHPDAEVSVPTEEPETEDNIFEAIYGELLKNSDKILSALAFIGSVIIAFTYKKGLIPAVKNSLSHIIGGVKTLTEENEKGLTKIEESTEKMLARLEDTEEKLTALYSSLSEVEYLLAENEKKQKSAQDTRNILYSQVDMLYEIFMTSSLPEYKKDSVGKKISEMKKTLSADGVNNG